MRGRTFARKALGILTLTALAASSLSGGALAAQKEVGVGDNFFEPVNVIVTAGAAVHWARLADSDGAHNIASDDGLFRSGDPTNGAIDYSAVFSSGTFPYKCEVHSNMTGTINVKPKILAAPTGLPLTVMWAKGTVRDTGSAFKVQYKVGTSTWKTWKTKTTAAKAVFGKRSKPIRVTAGKKYSFRVISQNSATGASSWSPVASIKP